MVYSEYWKIFLIFIILRNRVNNLISKSFFPAIFNILKESLLVQKQTIHLYHNSELDLYWPGCQKGPFLSEIGIQRAHRVSSLSISWLYIITLSSVCLSCSIAVLTENIRSASQTFQTAVDWRYAFNQPTRHNNEVVTGFTKTFPKLFDLEFLELKVKKKLIIWESTWINQTPVRPY